MECKGDCVFNIDGKCTKQSKKDIDKLIAQLTKDMRKAAAMLRCMPSAVVIVDSNMEIVEANDSFEQMFYDDIISHEQMFVNTKIEHIF